MIQIRRPFPEQVQSTTFSISNSYCVCTHFMYLVQVHSICIYKYINPTTHVEVFQQFLESKNRKHDMIPVQNNKPVTDDTHAHTDTLPLVYNHHDTLPLVNNHHLRLNTTLRQVRVHRSITVQVIVMDSNNFYMRPHCNMMVKILHTMCSVRLLFQER